ncbi:MAG: ABC transporter permease [Oscillospiraceae bacterium]
MLNILIGAVSLGLLWSVMTTGVFVTYRILDYADLTVEGSIVMGAAIAAKLISEGVNPIIATLVAIVGGMAAGGVTGLLNTKLKIPGLLAGILSMIALYSINIRIMGKANITLLKSETVFTMVEDLGIKGNAGVIAVGGAIIIVIVAFLYWFFGTEIGCAVRATGDNRKMARAQGVNTDNMKILALSLSNGLVALSGALIAQNQCFADMQMGQGAIVIGLASVIIGEVLFYRHNFLNRLISIALGAIAYRIIIACVIEMGMNPLDLKLFTAITVAIALALPTFKGQIAKALAPLKIFKNKKKTGAQ